MTNTAICTFRDYLWKEKSNRMTLCISIIMILIQLAIFKYYYPNAGFIDGDSYVYLDSAFWNKSINTYMVGYSMFLRLFSVFSTSDFLLVSFQYLLIQSGALLLLYTIFYFFKPYKFIQYTLLAFVVINPLFLFMANYVSSDGLFLALSLFWFSTLIWMINKPSLKIIIYNSALLFFCFTVRYNALIYPVVSLLIISLTRQATRHKIAGIFLIVLSVAGFVIYNGDKYKELTGKWQYTPFSGWQLANNAMYAYRYVDSSKRLPVAAKYIKLDNMIRHYFDTTTNPFTHPEILLRASTVYMWDPNSPLYKYRNTLFQRDSAVPELQKWASMGPYYSHYGMHIISKYPGYYFKYFVWPNACKYYAPPIEFLDHYNSGEDSVKPLAMQWFGYTTAKRLIRVKTLEVSMLNYYPILTGIVNAVYLVSILCLTMLGFFKKRTPVSDTLLVVTFLWVVNAIFTIFSSSAALRFQAFPIILVTLFAVTLIDLMIKNATSPDEANASSLNMEEKGKYQPAPHHLAG